MRDETKARHIRIFTDENGRKVAVDCDEISLVQQIRKYDGIRRIGYMWALTLRSGATVCVDYDVLIEDILVMLDMMP